MSTSDAWKHVNRVQTENASNPRVTCKYCSKVWVSSALQRCISHLKICTRLPPALYQSYQPDKLTGEDRPEDVATMSSVSSLHSHGRRQSRPSLWPDAMSAGEASMINQDFARFVFTSGISLTAVSEVGVWLLLCNIRFLQGTDAAAVG
jgi:hypothetical protein